MSAPGGAAARAAIGAAAGAPAGQQRQQQEGGGATSMIKNVLRVFLLTQAVQIGIKYFTAPKDAGNAAVPASAASPSSSAASAAVGRRNATAQPGIVPLWPQGTTYDVHFFVTGPDGRIDIANPDLPHYTVAGLHLGDWKWEYEWNTEVVLPKVCNDIRLYKAPVRKYTKPSVIARPYSTMARYTLTLFSSKTDHLFRHVNLDGKPKMSIITGSVSRNQLLHTLLAVFANNLSMQPSRSIRS